MLARALRSRGALLDPGAVARGTFTSNGFDPRGALQRLASLGEAVLDDFSLTERVVVGTFVHPGQILVDDLDNLSGTPRAARGGRRARRRRRARAASSAAARARAAATGTPALERGVGDLDPAQQHVLDVVATGTHLFVDTPAGADVTGTLAAARRRCRRLRPHRPLRAGAPPGRDRARRPARCRSASVTCCSTSPPTPAGGPRSRVGCSVP